MVSHSLVPRRRNAYPLARIDTEISFIAGNISDHSTCDDNQNAQVNELLSREKPAPRLGETGYAAGAVAGRQRVSRGFQTDFKRFEPAFVKIFCCGCVFQSAYVAAVPEAAGRSKRCESGLQASHRAYTDIHSQQSRNEIKNKRVVNIVEGK